MSQYKLRFYKKRRDRDKRGGDSHAMAEAEMERGNYQPWECQGLSRIAGHPQKVAERQGEFSPTGFRGSTAET